MQILPGQSRMYFLTVLIVVNSIFRVVQLRKHCYEEKSQPKRFVELRPQVASLVSNVLHHQSSEISGVYTGFLQMEPYCCFTWLKYGLFNSCRKCCSRHLQSCICVEVLLGFVMLLVRNILKVILANFDVLQSCEYRYLYGNFALVILHLAKCSQILHAVPGLCKLCFRVYNQITGNSPS